MIKFHYANTLDEDLLYLLQYRIADNFFYIETEEKKYVFLSGLDIEAFREGGNKEVTAVNIGLFRKNGLEKGNRLLGTALAILNEYKWDHELIVPSTFPLNLADSLRAENIQLIVREDWCEERMRKSPEEISAIASNMKVTAGAFKLVEDILSASELKGENIYSDKAVLTSEVIKRKIEHYFLDYDLESPHGLIVSNAEDSAYPHHMGFGPLRANQTIVVDLFPQSRKNHYFADMTRTYVKGKPNETVVKMYEAVREAQEASLLALKPGLLCREAYAVSAEVIKSHGFDVGEKGYIHSLGHGLGVGLHEAPYLGLNSKDKLEVGMVLTIEPGLYYEKYGGVRIEDTVVITENGYKNLTNYHKDKWIIK